LYCIQVIKIYIQMKIEIKLERLLNTTERSGSQAQAVNGKETHRACNCYTGSYSRTAFQDGKDGYATILLGISLSTTHGHPFFPPRQLSWPLRTGPF
jgi:hypothetical protein